MPEVKQPQDFCSDILVRLPVFINASALLVDAKLLVGGTISILLPKTISPNLGETARWTVTVQETVAWSHARVARNTMWATSSEDIVDSVDFDDRAEFV